MKKGKMKSVQHKQDERIHLEQSVTGKMCIVKKLTKAYNIIKSTSGKECNMTKVKHEKKCIMKKV